MDTIEHEDDPSTDDTLDAQRDIIRQSINEIANDIGIKMRDVSLTFPVYITVRNSGDSLRLLPLLSIGCRLAARQRIVCRTLEERIGCIGCEARLACAIATQGR